jgi:hypothetical protein
MYDEGIRGMYTRGYSSSTWCKIQGIRGFLELIHNFLLNPVHSKPYLKDLKENDRDYRLDRRICGSIVLPGKEPLERLPEQNTTVQS